MIGVGFKLLTRTPVPKLPPSNLTPGLYAKLPIHAEVCSKYN